MVELKPGTFAFELIVEKEKEHNIRNRQLNVKFEHGYFDKTHLNLIKNKCTNYGQLAVMLQKGAHNQADKQHINAILSEKAKKQMTGRVDFKKSEWLKTFPKLLMFIKQLRFVNQKSI